MAAAMAGRDFELDSAWQRLTNGGSEGPTSVVLEGEPGIGKTAVWSALTNRAAAGGYRVLQSRTAEAETGVSYAGLGDLLTDVDEADLDALPEPQRRALEVACLRREPIAPMEDLRVVGTALVTLFRSMARNKQVLVAIDDLQWLDGPTSRALAFGLRRMVGHPIAILATKREPSPAGDVSPLDALLRNWDAPITLGPLGQEQVGKIVGERLATPITRSQARRLHQISGGNPFLALEIGRFLVAASDEDDVWSQFVGRADAAKIARQRVLALPAVAREFLAAAAALSEPRMEMLAAFAGSRGAAAEAARTATAAGIARVDGDRLRFDHPVLGTAAYGIQPTARRRAIHRRLAELVDDPEQRARHLALAHVRPNEKVALAIAAGAQRASARGAQDAAAELAGAALRLTPAGSAMRPERAMATAIHLARSGELAHARELCEQLLRETPVGPGRAMLLRLIGEIRQQEDSFPEAIDALERGVEAAGGDATLSAPIHLQLAYAHMNLNAPAKAVGHAELALDGAEQLGIPRLLGTALAVHQLTRFFAGEAIDRSTLERALSLEDPTAGDPGLFRPSLLYGAILNLTGSTIRAHALLKSVAQDARTLGDEASLVAVLDYVTWNSLFLGDVATAKAGANEAVQVARAMGTDIVMALALTARVWVDAFVGNLEEGRANGRECFELIRRTGWSAYIIWPAYAVASLEWSANDPNAAIAAIEEPLRAYDAAGYSENVMPFRGDLLEAYIAVGRTDDVLAALARIDEHRERLSPIVLAIAERVRGLLTSSFGHHLDGLAAIDKALGHLDTVDPMPFEHARTMLAKGRIERRAKRRAAARSSLKAALSVFEELGCVLWAKRTNEELARLGGTADGELTETEGRVALLAARGMTNRQVSAAVFVTPKSVEGILDRVYSKLGIRSRAELGAWAATLPEDKRESETAGH